MSLAMPPAMVHPAHVARWAHGVFRVHGYRRREPQETVLYQTVAEHWPGFRERAEEAGGLPRFIEREFEEYCGACGDLSGAYVAVPDS